MSLYRSLTKEPYVVTLVWDFRSKSLSTVNRLYYFSGHDLISGQEVGLSRFPLILFD